MVKELAVARRVEGMGNSKTGVSRVPSLACMGQNFIFRDARLVLFAVKKNVPVHVRTALRTAAEERLRGHKKYTSSAEMNR